MLQVVGAVLLAVAVCSGFGVVWIVVAWFGNLGGAEDLLPLDGVWNILLLVVPFAAAWAGAAITRHGRSLEHRPVPVELFLAAPPRKYALYLRGFGSDWGDTEEVGDTPLPTHYPAPIAIIPSLINLIQSSRPSSRQDTEIADLFAGVCPVVALIQPGREQWVSNIRWVTAPGSDWTAPLLALAEKARFVILSPSGGAGIEWEFNRFAPETGPFHPGLVIWIRDEQAAGMCRRRLHDALSCEALRRIRAGMFLVMDCAALRCLDTRGLREVLLSSAP